MRAGKENNYMHTSICAKFYYLQCAKFPCKSRGFGQELLPCLVFLRQLYGLLPLSPNLWPCPGDHIEHAC